MKKHWSETITRRGWIVIATLTFAGVVAFTYLTRDVCWAGFDIVSCTAMIDGVVNK